MGENLRFLREAISLDMEKEQEEDEKVWKEDWEEGMEGGS